MSALETIARAEHWLRPVLHRLPPRLAIGLFSRGRTAFASWFGTHRVAGSESIAPFCRPVTAWGMPFNMPLWNAAGMFKKGEGYDTVARQGAGAYVAGTTTSQPRAGNTKEGIQWPAATYPKSGVASNWMGLPNEGHATVAARLAALTRVEGCPVGASVSADPGMPEPLALPGLVQGMQLYETAGIDYLELNESCPNVEGHHASHTALDAGLMARLRYVASEFLQQRKRSLPVVVKFSTDTDIDQIDTLVHTLIDLGFDGIILGNTSTQYSSVRPSIVPSERAVYDYFTSHFGGGLSGRPLRDRSLALCARARQAADAVRPAHEFQVVRCGGVSTAADVIASHNVGVMLNQWYVGYFDGFAAYGDAVYERLAREL